MKEIRPHRPAAAPGRRILFAVHGFPPRATAGVEVYCFRLARALLARGHEVRVLTAVHDLGATPYAVRRRVHQGVEISEVVSVHARGTLEATYEDPALGQAAREVLEEFRPEVVHVQHLLNLGTGVLHEARRLGAPVLLTLHDYWLSCPRDGLRMRENLDLCREMDHARCAICLRSSPYLVPPLQRRLAGRARAAGLGGLVHRLHDRAPRFAETLLHLLRHTPGASADLATGMDRRAVRLRAALEDVDRVLAPTAFVRDRALEFGVDPRRLMLRRIGVVSGPCRERAAGPRPRLGFVGTVAPHKGVHVLIDAFRGLSGEASLDVHGSLSVYPSYADRLRRAASGDARIRFHGAFPEGGQGPVLATLDALVVPSLWWENSPLTVLEGLAAGLAVVASRTGGVPELLEDGARGILVAPGDAGALQAVLADVVAGRRLGDALPPAPLASVDDEARDLAELYESLLAAREAGRSEPVRSSP